MRWLVGGQLYDVDRAEFTRADIGFEGDRIAHIGTAPESLDEDDDVLDLDGAFLLPGLIDCHVHLTQPTDAGDPSKASARSDAAVALFTADAAARTVSAGITTV